MQNNPLKQFFRRPAVYLKLPSQGKNYEPGSIEIPENGEIPVFPMTAIDEISLKTPDALFNGVALVDLIKSCIPAIKDPWKLNSNDLDAVLIAIKAASGEQILDIETKCPKCEAALTYGLNLLNVLSSLKYGDYDQLLEINELKIKFRPLTYKQMSQSILSQFELQKKYADVASLKTEEEINMKTISGLKEITALTIDILCDTIEYIESPNTRVEDVNFIKDFLNNCDSTTYIAIRDFNAKLKVSTQIKPLDVSCNDCGHNFNVEYTLNPADFFG